MFLTEVNINGRVTYCAMMMGTSGRLCQPGDLKTSSANFI
jgi:hypothetical protein